MNNLVPEIDRDVLDSPILETIRLPSYQQFIRSGYLPHKLSPVRLFRPILYNINLARANNFAHRDFGEKESGREAWNRWVILKPPVFCGKAHEDVESGVSLSTCTRVGNCLCGHPEEGGFFHTLTMGGYVAQKYDPTLPHPGSVLRKISNLDDRANMLHLPGAVREFFFPHEPNKKSEGVYGKWVNWLIRKQERKLGEQVIIPYTKRVTAILGSL